MIPKPVPTVEDPLICPAVGEQHLSTCPDAFAEGKSLAAAFSSVLYNLF
jgi:hypothetical protein